MMDSYAVIFGLLCIAACSTAKEVDGEITFDEDFSTEYTISSDGFNLTFTVSLVGDSYLAMGVSSDGSMDSEGAGSDMIICSDDGDGPQVKRYWTTASATPTGGVLVPGASCTQEGSMSTMTFTRAANATTSTQRSISVEPGQETYLIWAYRPDSTALAYHTNYGSVLVDMSRGSSEVVKETASTLLWMHAVCMVLAWGALLPFGVVQQHLKTTPLRCLGLEHSVYNHRAIQYMGWVCQIVGFVAVLVHMDGQLIFSGSYSLHAIVGLVVTIVGTLQPAIAFIRTYVPRKPWRLVHVSLGYGAILGGVFNAAYGFYMTHYLDPPYQDGFSVATGLLLTFCLGAVVVYGAAIKLGVKQLLKPETGTDSVKLKGLLAHPYQLEG